MLPTATNIGKSHPDSCSSSTPCRAATIPARFPLAITIWVAIPYSALKYIHHHARLTIINTTVVEVSNYTLMNFDVPKSDFANRYQALPVLYN